MSATVTDREIALEAALQSLVNCIYAGVIDELRSVWGNTNANVVTHWRDNAMTVLDGGGGQYGVILRENRHLRAALERARHQLVTLHGLTAADGMAPDQTWTIDENAAIEAIDAALNGGAS